MSVQILSFVQDFAVLYVGTPGHWVLLAYCLWLQRRQRLLRAEYADAPRWEALVTSGSTHVARLNLMNVPRLSDALLGLRTAVERTVGAWLSTWAVADKPSMRALPTITD